MKERYDLIMKNEKPKKPLFNINTTAIKNVLKSEEVRKAAKDVLKAAKGVRDSFDINK